jgi:hypothetical protein
MAKQKTQSATETAPAAPTNGNKPVKVFKAKGGIRVSIWENVATTDEGERKFCKAALQKIFKDDKGEYKTTTSLSSGDLLTAARLLEKSWDWMSEREAAQYGEMQE